MHERLPHVLLHPWKSRSLRERGMRASRSASTGRAALLHIFSNVAEFTESTFEERSVGSLERSTCHRIREGTLMHFLDRVNPWNYAY